MHNARKSLRAKGFTLIELLVVLIVIGFLTGLLLLRAPQSESRNLELTARNIQQYLYTLSQWSLDTGRVLGVQLKPQGLVAIDFSRTQVLDSSARLSNSNSVEGQQMDALDVELQALNFSSAARANLQVMTQVGSSSARAGRDTSIVIYPNGELSSFSLSIEANEPSTELIELVSDGLNVSFKRNPPS